MASSKRGVGNVVAPWPFLVFGAGALAGAAIACPLLGPIRGGMAAFDFASVSFVCCVIPLFRYEAAQMRQAALQNDANRGSLLLISAAVTIAILTAVASELSHKGKPHPIDVALVIGTLCLCWIFSNLVYALHYAHLFYTHDLHGQDSGGLRFPETREPNYWDFAYFSSCLGMTFQTSDVDITSRRIRRTAIFHTLGAFVFNLGVIAFSINILGSS
jgi:uncharacterized membrane protein